MPLNRWPTKNWHRVSVEEPERANEASKRKKKNANERTTLCPTEKDKQKIVDEVQRASLDIRRKRRPEITTVAGRPRRIEVSTAAHAAPCSSQKCSFIYILSRSSSFLQPIYRRSIHPPVHTVVLYLDRSITIYRLFALAMRALGARWRMTCSYSIWREGTKIIKKCMPDSERHRTSANCERVRTYIVWRERRKVCVCGVRAVYESRTLHQTRAFFFILSIFVY